MGRPTVVAAGGTSMAISNGNDIDCTALPAPIRTAVPQLWAWAAEQDSPSPSSGAAAHMAPGASENS
jgi:hypothetical protein